MGIKPLVLVSSIATVTSAYAGNVYVLGAAGQSHFKQGMGDPDRALEYSANLTADGAPGSASHFDNDPIGYKLQIGYSFTPNFAVEGGYADLGEQRYHVDFTTGEGRVKVRDYGWDMAALAIAPIRGPFSVFGKVGVIEATVKNHLAGADAGGSFSNAHSYTHMRPLYGIGGMYAVNDNASVRLEAERYDDLGNHKTGASNVDLISLGAAYKFF
jgi:OOP family OmpA-OmpF porin